MLLCFCRSILPIVSIITVTPRTKDGDNGEKKFWTPVQSPAAKQSETLAPRARASKTKMWRVEPGASILAPPEGPTKYGEKGVEEKRKLCGIPRASKIEKLF